MLGTLNDTNYVKFSMVVFNFLFLHPHPIVIVVIYYDKLINITNISARIRGGVEDDLLLAFPINGKLFRIRWTIIDLSGSFHN